MKKLTLAVLKNYSQSFDYNLTEEQLKKVYEELTWLGGPVTEPDIFDEFENV